MALTGMSMLEDLEPYLSLADTVSCGSLSNKTSQGALSSSARPSRQTSKVSVGELVDDHEAQVDTDSLSSEAARQPALPDVSMLMLKNESLIGVVGQFLRK